MIVVFTLWCPSGSCTVRTARRVACRKTRWTPPLVEAMTPVRPGMKVPRSRRGREVHPADTLFQIRLVKLPHPYEMQVAGGAGGRGELIGEDTPARQGPGSRDKKTGSRYGSGSADAGSGGQKSFCGSFRRAAGTRFGFFRGDNGLSSTPAEFFRLPQSCRNSFWFFAGRQRPVVNSRRIFSASAELRKLVLVFSGETTDCRQLPQTDFRSRRAAETPAEFFWLAQSRGNSRRNFSASADRRKLARNRRKRRQREAGL